MTNIRAVIVDDEERGIIALKQLLLRYCPNVLIAGEATNIADAASTIHTTKPDVVFLDIEMPDGNGFQLIQQFEQIDFQVIFVTAYQEYAIQAIKCSALDYLLKPIRPKDLQDAVQRIHMKQPGKGNDQLALLRSHLTNSNSPTRIVLSTAEGYYPVRVEDIIYCKANDSYTHVYLCGGKHYLVSRNLKEIEDMLVYPSFYRIHKSFLINLNHIEKITKTDGLCVHMSNHDQLPVSFRKKDDFLKSLTINTNNISTT